MSVLHKGQTQKERLRRNWSGPNTSEERMKWVTAHPSLLKEQMQDKGISGAEMNAIWVLITELWWLVWNRPLVRQVGSSHACFLSLRNSLLKFWFSGLNSCGPIRKQQKTESPLFLKKSKWPVSSSSITTVTCASETLSEREGKPVQASEA